MSLQIVDLSCPKCAGSLRYVPGMSVANCPFCDATVALVHSGRAGALEDETYRMARFTVSEQAFRDRFLAYLADGDYTPPDVIEAAQVQRHTGLFAPVYVFKGRWVSRFTARVGDDNEETYVAEEKVQDAKGRTRTRPVTRRRMVTRWRPFSGEASGDYTIAVLASKQVPEVAAELCQDLSGVKTEPVDGAAMQGYAMEAYASDPGAAYASRGAKLLDARVGTEVRRRMTFDHHSDLHYDCERREETVVRLYRPIWLALYSYGGANYVFASDGVTDRTVGTRPEDTALRAEAESLSRTRTMLWIVGILLCWTVIAPILAFMYYRSSVAPKVAAHEARVDASRTARQTAVSHARGGQRSA